MGRGRTWEQPALSTPGAVLVGVGMGLLAVIAYFGAGILLELWTLREFLLGHTAFEFGRLLLAAGLAITVVGVPITAYLRFRKILPLVVFGLLVFAWFVVGASRDLSLAAFFDLALDASWYAPSYLVLYLAAAGLERALELSSKI